MNELILNKAKKFLSSYLQDNSSNNETDASFRESWQFVVLHSFRVEGYVRKIIMHEDLHLTPDEVLLTRLAAILHDVGKIHIKDGHALMGREIVDKWLRNNQVIADEIKETERLLYIIEKHSNKEETDFDICLKVLKDADFLDEVGIMSIFMFSRRIDNRNPYFFQLLADLIEDKELKFCENSFNRLNTVGAKSILKQKLNFVNLFIDQLKAEISGTEMFGSVNIEDYISQLPENTHTT